MSEREKSVPFPFVSSYAAGPRFPAHEAEFAYYLWAGQLPKLVSCSVAFNLMLCRSCQYTRVYLRLWLVLGSAIDDAAKFITYSFSYQQLRGPDRRGAIRVDGSFSLLLAMTHTSRASLASSNRWRALHDSFAVPAAHDGDANKCRRCWTISSIRRASRASTVWFLAHGVMCTLHEHRNASFPPHDQHVREIRLIHFVIFPFTRPAVPVDR